MNILCTFPGKFGDLLWALPTVRAISRRIGAPVDLMVARDYSSITPLISLQPYIRFCGGVDNWITQDTAPISPRVPQLLPHLEIGTAERGYDYILHLGYRSWPLPDVCRHTWDTAALEIINRYPQAAQDGVFGDQFWNPAELDLQTPWIRVKPWTNIPHPVVFGWTDEYFELKYGLTRLLLRSVTKAVSGFMFCTDGSRWQREAGFDATPWLEEARRIAAASVFVGCCSALHVLAVALGIPVVLVEPQPMRHNDTFYPVGKTGPQVTLVTGSDGLPTFDARHTQDVLERILHAQSDRYRQAEVR